MVIVLTYKTLYEYNGIQSNIREIPIQSAIDLLR